MNDLAQEVVAGRVAGRVVERLEPVDVDVRHDEALAGAMGAVQLPLDRREPDAPAQRPGQMVDALERELLGGCGPVERGLPAILGGPLAVARRRLALHRRLGPARGRSLPVAGRAQQEVDPDRADAVAPGVELQSLDLGVERRGQLVTGPRRSVALLGPPIPPRRRLVPDARRLRPRVDGQIPLGRALRPGAPAARVSRVVLTVAERLVLVGRVLIAIGRKLVAPGGVLVGVRPRLIEIGAGPVGVRRRLIEIGQRLILPIILDRLELLVRHGRPFLSGPSPAPEP